MSLRNCARCKKEFSLPPTKAARARVFCSRECFQADRADHQIAVTCAQCGKVFQSVKALEHRKRFCSKVCSRAFYRAGETEQRTCPICGTLYTSLVSKVRGHLTCSPACAHEAKRRALDVARDRRFASTRPQNRKTSKVTRVCEQCGKLFETFPSRKGRYCSRPCSRFGNSRRLTGTIRSSTLVNCDYCGKSRKLFRSRQRAFSGNFCNMQCYLASKQSGVERKVAAWLDTHHIPYQRQYKLGHRTIDFWSNGTAIEVNGCYWHACSSCGFTILNDAQRRRITSDKALQTYCNKRNIPLISIWEHDVNRNDFSAIAVLHS